MFIQVMFGMALATATIHLRIDTLRRTQTQVIDPYLLHLLTITMASGVS